MKYQLDIVKRKRACHFCNTYIQQGEKMFVELEYDPNLPYPTKRNICLNCASKIINKEFLGFLNTLVFEVQRAYKLLNLIKTEIEHQKIV